ncbi:MAG: hypothetical protein WBO17_07645 [Sphingorhabdus sp.]
MRAKNALLMVGVMLAASAGGLSVSAQDALPETPPELRDFRLDPPVRKPEPQSQPTPEPAAASPPPFERTLPESRASEPAPGTAPQPQPQARNSDRVEPRAQADTVNRVDATDRPAGVGVPQDLPEAALEPEVTQPVRANGASTAQPRTANWQIAAGLIAIFLLAGLAWLFWRRKARVAPEPLQELPGNRSDDVAQLPVPFPTRSAPVSSSPKPGIRPLIRIAFIPERATITFAMLNVKGQLQVSNEGSVDAQDLELRAGMISASHQQDRAMRAFFDTPLATASNALGHVKSGEKITMPIELSASLAEMHSFPLGDQRLLVPIVLASIHYKGLADDEILRAEIAYMIGRESNPPQSKMGPLRLDLGPRSFAQLGTRPMAA